MKWYKLLAMVSVLLLLIMAPKYAGALKNQTPLNENTVTPMPATFFYDGVDITGQIIVSPNDGNIYIPLQLIIDQLTDAKTQTSNGFSNCTITSDLSEINFSVGSTGILVDGVEYELASSPLLRDQKIYVPLEFVQNVLNCPVMEYAQPSVTAIFSEPIITGDAAENSIINNKLQEYLATDLYNLPKDYSELHKRFTKTIHPDDIDLFCQNLNEAVKTPTSWGAVEFLESRVMVRTSDAAVVYYKVMYTDGSSEETIDGLWGLQKYNDSWFARWNLP